jgi:hypothetical protein
MPRHLLPAIAIATLALPGARASADDCMCVGPENAYGVAIAGVMAGVMLPAAVLESPDDTIETPDPLAPSADAVAAAAPRRTSAPVAWCISADDPRCQRDDTGDAPQRITLGTAPWVRLMGRPRVPAPGVARVRFSAFEQQRGPTGSASPLERPPRA